MREAGVLNAQEVQHCGVQVVHVHRVFHDVVAEVVGAPIHKARLDAAAGHPQRKTPGMMVATKAVGTNVALRISGAPKLTAPDNQRVVKKPTLLKVLDEGAAGLVGVAGLGLDAIGQSTVMIPVAVTQLDEANPALGQATRQEAVVGKGRFAGLSPIQLEHRFGFGRQVYQLRHARLHAEGQFVALDMRGNVRITQNSQTLAVEGLHGIEQLPTRVTAHARRVGDIKNWVSLAAQLNALVVG